MAGRRFLYPNDVDAREVSLERASSVVPLHDFAHDDRLTLRSAVHPVSLIPPGAISNLTHEHFGSQNRGIEVLLHDNRRLASAHVTLNQDLVIAQEELRRISAAAEGVKAERDAQIRDAYERFSKLETEVSVLQTLKAELSQVVTDVEKLEAINKDLTVKLNTIHGDISRANDEVDQIPEIQSAIEQMHRELQKGRVAVEYEKKVHADNLEHRRLMERSIHSMSLEIDKLRADLGMSEKRSAANQSDFFSGNPSVGHAESLHTNSCTVISPFERGMLPVQQRSYLHR